MPPRCQVPRAAPDAHGRYYLFPMIDAWTTVFQVPGKRTTGTGQQYIVMEYLEGPGMNSVLVAKDPRLDRTVAVKVLRRGNLASDEELVPVGAHGGPGSGAGLYDFARREDDFQ